MKHSKLAEWVLTNQDSGTLSKKSNYLLYKDIVLEYLPDVNIEINDEMLDVVTKTGVYIFALYHEKSVGMYCSYLYNNLTPYNYDMIMLNNLLDYSYIMSYIRDNKLSQILPISPISNSPEN